MKKVLVAGGVVLGAVVVLALIVAGWAGSVNNRLVGLEEHYKTAWAQVDTVLQRRFDLIPNLVATVKGYASHEREVFEEVTRLRSQWGAARTVEQKAEAATQLEGALSRLLLVAENYPQLRASEQFTALQYELAGTENRISVERQRYNDAVRAYNTAVRQFPASLIAGMLGFHPTDAYFEAAPTAREAPKVDFREAGRT